MNDTTNTINPTAVFDAPKPDYGPELSFYHANAKNTGVAITFRVEPATANLDGAVYFSIAKQKTVGNLNAQGLERFASFDWANKTTVKLGFLEIAEILMVFGGQASVLTHAGKEGFFHNSPSATTSITLKRADDPNRPGFILGVGRTPKADPNARQYATFAFWPAEAFALRAALQAEMGLLAFGIPRERRAPQGAAPAAPAAAQFAPPAPAASFAPAPAPAPFPAVTAAAPADGGFGDAF